MYIPGIPNSSGRREAVSEETSLSRRAYHRQFLRGDLVSAKYLRGSGANSDVCEAIGIVISAYDSNVYEPACCEVLIATPDGDVMEHLINSRDLTLLTAEDDDVS